MFHSSLARWLAVLTALASSAAMAQSLPASSGSPTPSGLPAYKSAFEGYRPFADEKATSWRQANETVYDRGGWQAYAKSASMDSDAKPGHSGHSMQMQAPSVVAPMKERP